MATRNYTTTYAAIIALAAAPPLVLWLAAALLLPEAREALLRLGVAVITASVVLAVIAARRLVRQLDRLAEHLERIAQGEISAGQVPQQDPARLLSPLAGSLDRLLDQYRQLEEELLRVSAGDLSVTTALQGDLAVAFDQMVQRQRTLVQKIDDTVMQINSAANEFKVNAEQQQRGALEQSSAVEENRRTMDSLLLSARKIAETAQAVLSNAEKSDENSRQLKDHIGTLSTHIQRIGEILQVIKEIANKSDLLALNAALEGTKAGEVGRGFSLVASQMQRLAENVMAAVRDIKELTSTITEATRATVLSTEENTKLVASTARSARQISLIVQQQQSGTEQVTKAMDDVAKVARESAAGSKQIVASTTDLVDLSSRLQQLVKQFRTASAPLGRADQEPPAP